MAFSCLGPNFDRFKVLGALRTLFPSHLQVIVWKSATNEALTMDNMTFDEMEAVVAYKASSENSNLLGDSQEEYCNLKAKYFSALNDLERVGVLQLMKNMFFTQCY